MQPCYEASGGSAKATLLSKQMTPRTIRQTCPTMLGHSLAHQAQVLSLMTCLIQISQGLEVPTQGPLLYYFVKQ